MIRITSITDLGCQLVDTPNTDDEGQLRFIGNVIISFATCLSPHSDLFTFLHVVFADIAFGTLEDVLALLGRTNTALDGKLQKPIT